MPCGHIQEGSRMSTTRIRRYSELAKFTTFEERFAYLKLDASVGVPTFGYDRYINQQFYRSQEWHRVRNHVILRDNGCDLGMAGYEISHRILIHHINPVARGDVLGREEWIFDPEFLITTTHRTHNALHYGAQDPYPKVVRERTPGDTKLW